MAERREHHSILTYRCGRCRTRLQIRHTFTIVWQDARPHRAYDRMQFQVAPVCQNCGERLDLLAGRDDTGRDYSRCEALCVPAKHTRFVCQCLTCHGTRHGEGMHAAS